LYHILLNHFYLSFSIQRLLVYPLSTSPAEDQQSALSTEHRPPTRSCPSLFITLTNSRYAKQSGTAISNKGGGQEWGGHEWIGRSHFSFLYVDDVSCQLELQCNLYLIFVILSITHSDRIIKNNTRFSILYDLKTLMFNSFTAL
jgi:hypothetical protein